MTAKPVSLAMSIEVVTGPLDENSESSGYTAGPALCEPSEGNICMSKSGREMP
jgi:hypothetical protein